MKVHVAQQHTNRSTLRGSLLARTNLSIFQDARFQPTPDQADQARIADSMFDKSEHPIVIEAPKEVLQIRLQHPADQAAGDDLSKGPQSMMGAELWSAAERAGQEVLLVNSGQHLSRGALERPVGDSWNPKGALLRLARLGDIDPPNVRRAISLAVDGLEHRLYPALEALLRRLHRLTIHPEFVEIIGDKMNTKVCSIVLQTLLFWDTSLSFVSNIIPQSVAADRKEYIKRLFTGSKMFDEETRFGLANVFLRQLIKQRVDRPVSARDEMYKGYGMMQNVFLGSHELREILDVLERRKGMIKMKNGFEKLQRNALSELKYRSFVYWRELAVALKLSLEPKEHKKWVEEVGRTYAKVFNAAMDLKLIPAPIGSSPLETVKKAVASYPKLEETDIAWRTLINGAGMAYRLGVRVTVNGLFVMPIVEGGGSGDEMAVCKALEARLMTTDLVIFDELLVSGKLFERFAGEKYIDQ